MMGFLQSELVQLKLNIGDSDGDSTPPELGRGAPPYRRWSLGIKIKRLLLKDLTINKAFLQQYHHAVKFFYKYAISY